MKVFVILEHSYPATGIESHIHSMHHVQIRGGKSSVKYYHSDLQVNPFANMGMFWVVLICIMNMPIRMHFRT